MRSSHGDTEYHSCALNQQIPPQHTHTFNSHFISSRCLSELTLTSNRPEFGLTLWCGRPACQQSALASPSRLSGYRFLSVSPTPSTSQRASISTGQEMKPLCPATPGRRRVEAKRRRRFPVVEFISSWRCDGGSGCVWLGRCWTDIRLKLTLDTTKTEVVEKAFTY